MFNKRIIIKRHTLNFCEAVCLLAAVYVTCYMLRQDDVFPMSINSAWYWISHWARHFHVIAVALLPVYVALMVFGTATIGIYLGSAIQRWINRFLSDTASIMRKAEMRNQKSNPMGFHCAAIKKIK